MATFFNGIAASLMAVTYGWVPASDDRYEYVVQISPAEVEALAEGRLPALTSAPPAGVGPIERVKVVVGDAALPRELTAVDRNSPRRIAAESGPVRQTVAKPVTPDWLPARRVEAVADPAVEDRAGDDDVGQLERRTVFQNPNVYNPTPAYDRARQPVVDAARDATRSLGEASGQTLRDLGDGARGVVDGLADSVRAGARGLGNTLNNTVNIGNDPYFDQRRQPAPAPTTAAPRAGYTPYNYNQPAPVAAGSATPLAPPGQLDTSISQPGQFNSQPQFNSQRTGAGTVPSQFTTPMATQPTDPRAADPRFNGPALPPADGRNSGIATQFGDRRSQPPAATDRSRIDSQFGPLPEESARLAPVSRAPQPTREPTSQWPYDSERREEPRRDLGESDRRAPAATNPDAWDDPWGSRGVDTRPVAATQPRSQFDAPGFGAPPAAGRGAGMTQPVAATAQQGGVTQAGVSPDVRAWAGGLNQQPTSQQPQTATEQQAPATPDSPLNTLVVSVLLAGSLAGNLYVATSYLDVRNKYRAALRRLPTGLHRSAAA